MNRSEVYRICVFVFGIAVSIFWIWRQKWVGLYFVCMLIGGGVLETQTKNAPVPGWILFILYLLATGFGAYKLFGKRGDRNKNPAGTDERQTGKKVNLNTDNGRADRRGTSFR